MEIRKYLVMVGDKYVSSPSNKLTDNYFFAGVFTDENIDKVFGYWDKESNGNAEIIDFN
jgi:hypothetical protein